MKAITLMHLALRDFHESSGLIPKVILLPKRMFQQFEREQRVLDEILPQEPPADDGWEDVRVVEHEGIETPEVY